MATSLERLQELTCNKLDRYIVLESGTVIYNGFVYTNSKDLIETVFTANTRLNFIEQLEVLEV